MNANSETPKAYLDGYADFYGREFLVTPDVLIPRPETEQLIDLALSLAGRPYLPGMKKPKRFLPKDRPIILDVGTGSGCIAVTLALEISEAEVWACDISESALKIAEKNANRLDADIHFIESNILEKVNLENMFYYLPGTIPPPDLIVANLPYVNKDWKWLDKEALSYEPEKALYAGGNGLALNRRLLNEAALLGIPLVILEADPCQHEALKKFAGKMGFRFRKAHGYALYFSL